VPTVESLVSSPKDFAVKWAVATLVADETTALPEVERVTAVNSELFSLPIKALVFVALSEIEVPWRLFVTVTTIEAPVTPRVGEVKVGVNATVPLAEFNVIVYVPGVDGAVHKVAIGAPALFVEA
jgi:hypothetical protein